MAEESEMREMWKVSILSWNDTAAAAAILDSNENFYRISFLQLKWIFNFYYQFDKYRTAHLL